MSIHTVNSGRRIGNRVEKKRILIACEGEKTEPIYFKCFRKYLDDQCFLEVIGEGYNTDSLVKQVIKKKNEEKRKKNPYDQVWCVFDRDSFPPEKFNLAIDLAQKEGIQVAYSNEAFEIWYLLHFNYLDTGMTRDLYKEKLTESLGFVYQKKSTIMYDKLKEKQADAIRNARQLLEWQNGMRKTPEDANPSTTVHLLVEELNRLGGSGAPASPAAPSRGIIPFLPLPG